MEPIEETLLEAAPETLQKNLPLLWKVFHHIEDHPEEWYQGAYVREVQRPNFCGTVFCFAGHAALIANPEAVPTKDLQSWSGLLRFPDGTQRRIAEVAQKDLGLTLRERWNLFDGGNTLNDLRHIIEEWEKEETENG